MKPTVTLTPQEQQAYSDACHAYNCQNCRALKALALLLMFRVWGQLTPAERKEYGNNHENVPVEDAYELAYQLYTNDHSVLKSDPLLRIAVLKIVKEFYG